MSSRQPKSRKSILIFSVAIHFALLIALFILPFFKRKPKEQKLTSLNVSVDLSKLSHTPTPPAPSPQAEITPISEPNKPDPPTDDKPKRNIEKEALDKAAKVKQEALDRAAKELQARKAKEKAEAEKRAATKRKKELEQKKKREQEAAKKRELDKKKKAEEERKRKEREAAKKREAERARKRAAEAEALRKRNAAARASAQQKLKSQYNLLLAADVRRQWHNQYLNRSGIDLNDRVKIQVTINRNGTVTSKKIIKLARSVALNRAAKTFLAGLKTLPSFPKNMDAPYITETLSLGIQ